jgi:hypothetical protein
VDPGLQRAGDPGCAINAQAARGVDLASFVERGSYLSRPTAGVTPAARKGHPMIHHVSLPARDVNHVAKVLSELTGWKARPFLGPVAGAVMMLAEDGQGTAIEIYPDGTVIQPGEGEVQATMRQEASQGLFPFHLLLSLDIDPAEVKRIGEREGWRTLHCWRGPPGKPAFELIEFWIENRLMIEVATPAMLPSYLAAATAEAHDRALAGTDRAAPEPA